MKRSLVLDCGLLAVPAISNTESDVSETISTLISVAAGLRDGCECAIYALEEAPHILASANLYPVSLSISNLLRDCQLLHVYAAEDIRRAINDILNRVGRLETLSGVDFMVPTYIGTDPDVLGGREGPLREALEVTLVHAALAARNVKPDMLKLLIAKHLVRNEVKLTASVDDIEPTLPPDQITTLTDFQATIGTVASLESMLADACPGVLWEYAETDEEICAAIRRAAQRIRHASGCPDPVGACEAFLLGACFRESLHAWGAAMNGSHAGVTLDTCARLIARMPKSNLERFWLPSGSKGQRENVTRDVDKAEGWRTHLTGGHEALRLMYWRKRDGTIDWLMLVANPSYRFFRRVQTAREGMITGRAAHA